MNKILAAKITPADNICSGPFCNQLNTSGAGSVFGSLIGKSVRMILIFGGGLFLIYLLWGALDWIGSGGEKEKIVKAQGKITQAIVGICILFSVWTLWSFLAGYVLGIIVEDSASGSWTIKLPSFNP